MDAVPMKMSYSINEQVVSFLRFNEMAIESKYRKKLLWLKCFNKVASPVAMSVVCDW